MIHWEPVRELASLRRAMDNIFEDTFFRPSRIISEQGPELEAPMDMYQTDDDVVVKASLPGVKPEEVEISVMGNTLTIKGEHQEEKEEKDKDYIRRERSYGAFSRSMVIPVAIQADKAAADFKDGVLTLTLPKAEEIKPKQIKISPQAKIEEPKKKDK
ncbi:MAG: Hsp20/alpha crystallin family protein [Chloroflexi bacterium]|nr:Hsp20/alpha crystallin family protein [Chloroflexota bacterium]